MTLGARLLLAGGVLSFAVAALHVAIVFVGAPAYRWFGAGEAFAQQAATGAWQPAAVTLALAVVFAAWGMFAVSGAGIGPRLRLLKAGLIAIGAVYALRGLVLIAELSALSRGVRLRDQDPVFSVVSLAIGVCYLTGTVLEWRRLRG